MKMFGLNAGTNYIDNGYGHIARINAGKISAIEVYSQSPGEVTITQKAGSFSKMQSIANITVDATGYGAATGLGKLFAYGDSITVTGMPVDGGNEYAVRCFYE